MRRSSTSRCRADEAAVLTDLDGSGAAVLASERFVEEHDLSRPRRRDRRPAHGHRHAGELREPLRDRRRRRRDDQEGGRPGLRGGRSRPRRRRRLRAPRLLQRQRADRALRGGFGFAAEGEGHKLVEEEATTYGGKGPVVNPSGGLIPEGPPAGEPPAWCSAASSPGSSAAPPMRQVTGAEVAPSTTSASAARPVGLYRHASATASREPKPTEKKENDSWQRSRRPLRSQRPPTRSGTSSPRPRATPTGRRPTPLPGGPARDQRGQHLQGEGDDHGDARGGQLDLTKVDPGSGFELEGKGPMGTHLRSSYRIESNGEGCSPARVRVRGAALAAMAGPSRKRLTTPSRSRSPSSRSWSEVRKRPAPGRPLHFPRGLAGADPTLVAGAPIDVDVDQEAPAPASARTRSASGRGIASIALVATPIVRGT